MAVVAVAAAMVMMMTAAPLTELCVGGCGFGASTHLHACHFGIVVLQRYQARPYLAYLTTVLLPLHKCTKQ